LKVLWLDVKQGTWTQVVDAWPFLGCANMKSNMKTRVVDAAMVVLVRVEDAAGARGADAER
jgi:hypothetical protein